MVIPTKQRVLEANIADLYKENEKFSEYILKHETENDERFDDLNKGCILLLFFVVLLFFGLLAVFIFHNNSEDAHQPIISFIYRYMENYRFDLDKQLEARGWHKECVENGTQTKINTELIDACCVQITTNTTDTEFSGFVCIDVDMLGGDIVISGKTIDVHRCNEVQKEKEITYCTKYQLVTAS